MRDTLVCLLMLAAAGPALCREYSVGPRGDDANPGTRGKPWATLAKANAALAAGDTATFLPGEYEGALSPERSGRRGAPITYRSDRPLGACLRGVNGGPAIALKARRHVAIEGFHVKPANGSWGSLTDCEDVVVRRCRMEDSRTAYVAFYVQGCKRVRILDNAFTRQLLMHNDLILHGDMVHIYYSDRTVVEGNDFSKAGHGPAVWLCTTNDVIRRNVFHAEWGRLFALFNCSPCLFEENILMENYHGAGSADPGSKILVIDGIVRRNIACRNWGYVIHAMSYKLGDYPWWILTGTRLYHNTFANNASHAWWLSAPADREENIAGNVWKNNVFARHTPSGGGRTFLAGPIGEGNVWEHNLICGEQPGAQTLALWDAGARRSLPADLAGAEQRFPAMFRQNVDCDPRFVASEADDYALAAGSPCIDRGGVLTRAVGSGRGREVPVEDARWFYDGFGIEGERGDLVFVGARKHQARILRTDRQANTLLLDREVPWAAGDPVSLPYAGKAPDLGAVERGGRRWLRPVAVPPGLRWRLPSDPTAPLVATDFEESDVDTWGHLWYWGRFDIPGAAVPARRVKEGAFRGTHCVHLRAEADGPSLEASITPRGWDAGRYPWVRFAYRIPPGVPVGIAFDAFPGAGSSGNRVVSVGGSPACLAAGKPQLDGCRLVDDGEWHTLLVDARVVQEAHPDARQLYGFRFYAPVRYRAGQEWWLDHFAVLPRKPE